MSYKATFYMKSGNKIKIRDFKEITVTRDNNGQLKEIAWEFMKPNTTRIARLSLDDIEVVIVKHQWF